jgi:hypothetical protein
MTEGPHDTLRDDLAETLAMGVPVADMYREQADALVPVVLRFADAQVADVRAKLDAIGAVLAAIDSDDACILAAVRIGRIVKGQP